MIYDSGFVCGYTTVWPVNVSVYNIYRVVLNLLYNTTMLDRMTEGH